VLGKELNDLRERRKQVLSSQSWTGSNSKANESEPDCVRRLRRESLDNDLVGLALSGVGTRSATFNLGVLQGLAQLRLLKSLDYLATVSGGGYIGGWLAAWIKREGSVVNVEKQLHPNHVVEAEADRWRGQVEVQDNGIQ